MLHAYLDGELSPDVRQQFERRLAQDAALRAALEGERRFREALRRRVRQTRAPASLYRRVDALFDEFEAAHEDPTPTLWDRILDWFRTPARVPRWAAVAYAMVLLLMVGSVLQLERPRVEPATGTQATAHTVFRRLGGKHAVYFSGTPVLDVRGTPEEIAAWFNGRVTFPITVPQLPGWKLEGARLGEFHHVGTMHLLYTRSDRRISLILFEPRDSDFPEDTRRTVDGRDVFVGAFDAYPVILWRDAEVGYALVGDEGMPLEELLSLVTQFQTP